MAGRSSALYFRCPKMSTSAAVVNPPAASATPQATSNEIQMPQGLWLSRFVTRPRPSSIRVMPNA